MTTHQLSVSVKSNFSGELYAFNYETLTNVSEVEEIYVEFLNSGTEPYDLLLEESLRPGIHFVGHLAGRIT